MDWTVPHGTYQQMVSTASSCSPSDAGPLPCGKECKNRQACYNRHGPRAEGVLLAPRGSGRDTKMQLILTHENADFDAVASLVAAHKLYPTASPVLPRRVNRNVRAFLSLYGPSLPLVEPNTLPRGQHVQRVVLVDTQKLSFVRGMGKDIAEVLVIDHHHPPESKPQNWRFQCDQVGAATTLLAEAISSRLIPISPAEATLMLAGIYEDTGNLTYTSTTPRDLRAAAWLIDQGADLAVATEFLDHPLTPAQQQIYEGLREHLDIVEINGHPIALSWAESPPDTEEEISTLAHKLRELVEPSALFILVQLGENVQLVARSTTDDLNVAEVSEHFGGGGHDRAAAALIKGRSAQEALEELRDLLPKYVRPRIKVRDIMSFGVRTVRPTNSVADVARRMLQTGHEGFPVIDETGQVIGLVTRNAVDRAIQHGLKDQPVRRIMQHGTHAVHPDDSIERVRTLMIQTGWGQIPVVSGDQLVGVITRTDLIRLKPSAQAADRKRIAHLMEQAIPAPVLKLIREIGSAAAKQGYRLYFVGGLVRDLLLGQPVFDIDLVVEGNAIKLAQRMARRYGGQVRSHRRFGTAKWLLPDDLWDRFSDDQSTQVSSTDMNTKLPEFIDLVTARTEFYEHPTALPLVEQSSIKQDLHRRDFTINTLAICLDPQRWGELLDFYGGRADLEDGIIRVLHSLSFVDDPTRILRAARFEARLGFRLDERSEALISEALPLLKRVSGERIRHELDLIFREAQPEAALRRLEQLGALREIHPSLHCDAWLEERFKALRTEFQATQWELDDPDDRVLLYWALFTYRLDDDAFAEVKERLRLSRDLASLHATRRAVVDMLSELTTSMRPSQVVARLDAFPMPALALGWLTTENAQAREALDQYAGQWRHVQPELTGKDLRRLGIKPGPQYRDILWRLRQARLDGEIHTRDEELAMVARILDAGSEQAKTVKEM